MARVWRSRRSLDTPRPAGRRWARLRSGGSRATHLIARVTGRRRERGATGGTQLVYPRPERTWRRIAARRPGSVSFPSRRDNNPPIAPVTPALGLAPADVAAPSVPVTIPLLPGERTPIRRLQFAIANGCTVASLLFGMSAVFLALSGELRFAAIAIIACTVFDGLDGGLARKFGVSSPFGAQMDSLADLSSFGVATGIVSYLWLVDQGAQPVTAGLACSLLAVCAAIRLARFNVSPKDGRYFCGVPTTMAAAVLAINMIVGPELPVGAEVALVALFAVAMVSSFPYAKLARVLRLPLWLWVVPAICAMISVPGTMVAVVGAYLISGPLLWFYLRHRHTPRPA